MLALGLLNCGVFVTLETSPRNRSERLPFGKAVHLSFTNVYNDRQSKRLWLTINTAKLPFNIRLNTGSRAINQFSLQAGYPRASWHIRCSRQLRKQDSKQN